MNFDIEDALINELSDYAPPYTQRNAENIELQLAQRIAAKPVKKTRRSFRTARRILLAAALCVVVVAVSGVAIAAIRGVDLGTLFNSFFGESPVAERVEVDKVAAYDDFEVRVVSAVSDGRYTNILLELTDTAKARLKAPLSFEFAGNRYDITNYSEEITPDGKSATVAMTIVDQGERMGENMFKLEAVYSGVEYSAHKQLDFDLAANLYSGGSLTFDEWDAEFNPNSEPSVHTTSEDKNLQPENLNFLPRSDMYIITEPMYWLPLTNLGVIDGLLHIQVKNIGNHSRVETSVLGLLDSDDVYYDSVFGIQGPLSGGYSEFVFDLGGRDVSEFQLAFNGSLAENVIRGPWDISYTVPDESMVKTVTETFTPPKDAPYSNMVASVEFTVSAVHTTMKYYTTRSEEFRTISHPIEEQRTYIEDVNAVLSDIFGEEAFITLSDGSTISLLRGQGMADAMGATIDLETEYFDMNELYSITYFGTEFVFGQ
jgi:hypothetical protein